MEDKGTVPASNDDALAAEARSALLGPIEAARRARRANMQAIVKDAALKRDEAGPQAPWQAAPNAQETRKALVCHVVDEMEHKIAAGRARLEQRCAVYSRFLFESPITVEDKYTEEAKQRLLDLHACATWAEADAEVLLETERRQGLPADEPCVIEKVTQAPPPNPEVARDYWRRRDADIAQSIYESLPEDRRNGPAIEAVHTLFEINDAEDATFLYLDSEACERNTRLRDLMCLALQHVGADRRANRSAASSEKFVKTALHFVALVVEHAKAEAATTPPPPYAEEFHEAAIEYERAEAALGKRHDAMARLGREREETLQRIEQLCGPEYAARFKR